ncbi:MAG: twin-arginine translocation signal domain-containing protein, partial [Actinomycetota bacterium]
RRGLSRRRALQMLAASGGAAAGGTLIVSQPAIADSGSEACRFDFTGSPTASFEATNTVPFIGSDSISISVSGVSGLCPCGGSSTTEYAMAIVAPNATLTTGGWIGSSTAGAAGPNLLWPFDGGPFTISAGVQVTCAGGTGGTTVRCRFASADFNMPGGFFEVVDSSFGLPTNNGNSTLPNLPACTDALATRSRSGRGGGLVPGAGARDPGLRQRAEAAEQEQAGGLAPAGDSPTPSTSSTTPTTSASTTSTTSTSSTTTTSAPPPSTSTTTTNAPSTSSTTTTSTAPPTSPAPPSSVPTTSTSPSAPSTTSTTTG